MPGRGRRPLLLPRPVEAGRHLLPRAVSWVEILGKGRCLLAQKVHSAEGWRMGICLFPRNDWTCAPTEVAGVKAQKSVLLKTLSVILEGRPSLVSFCHWQKTRVTRSRCHA